MNDSVKWFWLSGVVITGVLLYLLSPVLTPFMVAIILAYIGDPLVDRLEKCRLPRTVAVSVVFVILTIVLVVSLIYLVPMLERQIAVLTRNVPGYIDILQHRFLPWMQERFGIEMQLDAAQLKSSLAAHWQDAGGIVTSVVGYITRSGLVLLGWTANLLLIPVVTFYLLRDWDVLIGRIHELIPRRIEPVISKLAKSSDEVLGAFLRGQLTVMLALAIVYSLGLSIAGLDLAILIGVIAGVVSFVPYLGLIVGITLASIAALMQFQDVTHLGYVAIVFVIGQLLEGMVLTPMLIGERIGLHPVAVIFAVLAGGQLFGFLGVLVALPVTAVIAVILRYVHEQYKFSVLYGKA